MKKLFAILIPMVIGILLTTTVFAQTPEKMSYQAVIRNSSDDLITNAQIGMQISILQGSASGTVVYTETQTPTTNANGLVSIQIGSGAGFSNIDWANDIYFIKTETDPAGGINYTITGTSQLLSVPYSLHAKTAETLSGGETDPSVPIGEQNGNMQYWNGTAWVLVAATTNEEATLHMIGGVPTWVDGNSGTPNVTNPTTGEIWMDRNLGASQVATSSGDEDAYGDLYQWGRAAEGHQVRTSATSSTLATTAEPDQGNDWDGKFICTWDTLPCDWLTPQNDNLWQGVNGTNNPCPAGYRLPTETELEAERASWTSNNAAGAYASPLKLSNAGLRSYWDGVLYNEGAAGTYWSSTGSGDYSYYLNFFSNNAFLFTYYRADGNSCRCIKD